MPRLPKPARLPQGVTEDHGKYRYRFQKNGKRYSIQLDRLPRTRKELDEIREGIVAESATIPDGKLTFQEAAERFIRESEKVLSPSTLKKYASNLKNRPDRFRNKRLSAIQQSDLNAIVRTFSDRSPKTIRNIHGFAVSVMRYYDPNFTSHTKLPVGTQPDYYAPEPEDVSAILKAVAGTKYEIPFGLAVMGLRRSEICAVTSDDLEGDLLSVNKAKVVDPEGGYVIKPYTKTGYNRAVLLPHELAEKIRAQGYAYQGFPNNLERRLTQVQNELGLAHFSFHKFRHYFVSQSSAMGIPDKYIQDAGGWKSDIVMKRRYLQAQKSKTIAVGKQYASFAGKLLSNQ